MKNLKQWQIENDALFDKKFQEQPDITFTDGEGYYQHSTDFKQFLHSSQESLKKVMVEEISDAIKHKFNGYGGTLGFTQSELLDFINNLSKE